MNRTIKWLAIASMGVLLLGCAQPALTDLGHSIRDAVATKIPYKILPSSPEAGGLRSILLTTDRTQEAQMVAAGIESEMTHLRIDERPYYTQVKTTTVGSAELTESQRQTLAKAAGVDGVISLYNGGTKFSQNTSSEDRSKCNVESTKLFSKCPSGQMRNYKVSCTTVTANVAVSMRVHRVSDARTVYVMPISGNMEQKTCSDSEERSLAQQQMSAAALKIAVSKAMKIVAPSYAQGPLDLMDADGPIAQDVKKRFNAAMEFAHKTRRMDEACNRFDELYADLKESPALTFNVAFCKEINGHFLQANQGYKRASELLNTPHSQVDRRIAMTEKAIRDNAVSSALSGINAPEASQGIDVAAGNGPRVALVIGNAQYQRSALINPINDARLVGNQLKKAGFDVSIFENVNSVRFGSVVSDFVQKARGAEMALFYYAGHAIQSDGENYLLPVDNAKVRSLEDVREGGAIQLGMITAQLDVAAPMVKLYVIDACRDSPLPATSRSISGGGLAAIKTLPQGSLMAYATAPGKTAEDGTGKNSVYSRHFAQQILQPNQTIEQAFKNVRNAVLAETRNRQEPTEVSSLSGRDMYFVKSR